MAHFECQDVMHIQYFGQTKTQFLWRNELLTCPTQYKMETIAMYVDNID